MINTNDILDSPKTLMRNGFAQGLIEMGEKHTNLVCLGLDISKSVGVDEFKQRFPSRFFSIGIAEQNAAGISAGLALSGKIPLFSTYAAFSSMRITDQIRVSICYNNLHVIIGGAHAGISVGTDGATHQALEDISVMRTLPNMTILCPCDENQTRNAVIAAVEKISGPVYIRYAREAVPNFSHPNDDFIPGNSKLLINGNDIGIISCGTTVYNSIVASEMLAKKGINASVLNLYSLKPADEQAIIALAKKTGKIITVEEHQIFGGLFSIVAEVLSKNYPVKVKPIAINDNFAESGSSQDLFIKYNLDSLSIYNSCIEFLNDKT